MGLTPRASRDAIGGFQARAGDGRARGEVLAVRVTAPPVDGRANEAVLRLLAAPSIYRRQHCALVAGESAPRDSSCARLERSTVVEVVGLELDEVRRRLDAAGGRD